MVAPVHRNLARDSFARAWRLVAPSRSRTIVAQLRERRPLSEPDALHRIELQLAELVAVAKSRVWFERVLVVAIVILAGVNGLDRVLSLGS